MAETLSLSLSYVELHALRGDEVHASLLLLLATHYSLLATHYSLLATHYSLLTTRYPR